MVLFSKFGSFWRKNLLLHETLEKPILSGDHKQNFGVFFLLILLIDAGSR